MDPNPLASIPSMTFRLVGLLACVLPLDALDGQVIQSLAQGTRVKIDTVGAMVSFTTRIARTSGDTLWVTRDRVVFNCNPACAQQRVEESLALSPERITRLYVSNGGASRGQSARRGALVGAAVTLLFGIASSSGGTSCDDCGGLVVAAGVVVALVGASAGAVLGALSANERWQQVPWPPKNR
jgi:hypothetical protein